MSPGRVVATISILGGLAVAGLYAGASSMPAGSALEAHGWSTGPGPVEVTMDETTGEVVRVGPGASVVLDVQTGHILEIN